MSLVTLEETVKALRDNGALVEVLHPDENTFGGSRRGGWRDESGDFRASGNGWTCARQKHGDRSHLVVLAVITVNSLNHAQEFTLA